MTDIVQSLRVGVGGRHNSWVETGGKKFVEHIGLIRVRCSSGRSIVKSIRNCRAARFELSDSCPEFLGITSVAGKVLKEVSFSNTDLIYNGVAEGSIFQQPVMAFSTFEFLIQALTLADCKSDWTSTLSLGLWAGLPHFHPPTLLHHQALVPETSHQPCIMFCVCLQKLLNS